jgi:hypothetical protein
MIVWVFLKMLWIYLILSLVALLRNQTISLPWSSGGISQTILHFSDKYCSTNGSLPFFLTFCRSLTLPPPKLETLSRHSILGPNGLNGQWRPPTINTGVCAMLLYLYISIVFYSKIILTFLYGYRSGIQLT